MQIKRTFLFFILFLNLSLAFAQMPSGFYYEAALFTPEGRAEAWKTFDLKAELRLDNAEGPLVYAETHQATTRADGTFGLHIGKGTPVTGNIEWVDWSYGKIFLLIDIDRGNGAGLICSHASLLMPVPMALYAANVEEYWKQNGSDLYYLNGNVGIGTSQPREALELGMDKAVRLSTTLTQLTSSSMLKLMWLNDSAKPAITWTDTLDTPRASLYAYHRGQEGEHDSVFCIGTSNRLGKIIPRFEMPWGKDIVELRTVNSDFKISDGYNFQVGLKTGSTGNASFFGNVFIMAKKKLGIGDKNWELEGVDANAQMEIFRGNSSSTMMIRQQDGLFPASLALRSNQVQWDLQVTDRLGFIHQGEEYFTMLPNGNTGIGITQPQEKLEVNGNIRIPEGYAYLTSGNDFAEYMETEEPLVPGDIAGINLHTGKIRKYRPGDEWAGIVSEEAGLASNHLPGRENDTGYALIGVKGQLRFNDQQTLREGRILYTPDRKRIGIILHNGKVFIR